MNKYPTQPIRWDAMPCSSKSLDKHLVCSPFSQSLESVQVDYGPLVATGILDLNRVRRRLDSAHILSPNAAQTTAAILYETITTIGARVQEIRLCCLPTEDYSTYECWAGFVRRTWNIPIKYRKQIPYYNFEGEFVACFGPVDALFVFLLLNETGYYTLSLPKAAEPIVQLHKERIMQTLSGMVQGRRNILLVVLEDENQKAALRAFKGFAIQVDYAVMLLEGNVRENK